MLQLLTIIVCLLSLFRRNKDEYCTYVALCEYYIVLISHRFNSNIVQTCAELIVGLNIN